MPVLTRKKKNPERVSGKEFFNAGLVTLTFPTSHFNSKDMNDTALFELTLKKGHSGSWGQSGPSGLEFILYLHLGSNQTPCSRELCRAVSCSHQTPHPRVKVAQLASAAITVGDLHMLVGA